MNKQYEIVVDLLSNYKAMNARIFNLNRKLSLIQKQKNNAIEGQFLKSSKLTDMPGVPSDGMKENKLLLIKDREYKDLENEESFIVDELENLHIMIDGINEALNSLTNRAKDIVYFLYIEKLGWQKICTIVNYSDRQCQRVRDEAITYLYSSLEPIKDVVNMSLFTNKKAV